MKSILYIPAKLIVLGLLLHLNMPFASAQTSVAGYPVPNDTSQISLSHLAAYITGSEPMSSLERTDKIIDWTYKNMDWSLSSNKYRSPKEILKRGGGNSQDITVLTHAILIASGVQTRWIEEVNIQPEKKQRQKSAESKMKEKGNNASLSGSRHCNHRWLEFWDEQAREWAPADPSLGVTGMDEWIKARVKFGERMQGAVLSNREMIVPIGVYVVNAQGNQVLEDRTSHYVIDAFNQYYGNKLNSLNSWKTWEQRISSIDPYVQHAIKGEANLHEQEKLISELAVSYDQLKKEYQDYLQTSRQ